MGFWSLGEQYPWRTMDEEKRLLEVGEADCELDLAQRAQRQPVAKVEKRLWGIVLLLSVLLMVSIAVNVLQALHRSLFDKRLTTFSDLEWLRQQIRTEHPEHGVIYSQFQGPPSNETAMSWRRLLDPFYFNMSNEEITKAGFPPSTAVKVKDGGFLASLGVYHELHCLNQLRNFLYIGTYPGNLSLHNVDYWHGHLDHCIEVLRLSVMCAADLSLYTFTWPEENNFTFLNAHSKSPRKCADWSQIEEWSLKRKISLTPTVLFPGHGQGISE